MSAEPKESVSGSELSPEDIEERVNECQDLYETAKDMADQCDYAGAADILSGVLTTLFVSFSFLSFNTLLFCFV